MPIRLQSKLRTVAHLAVGLGSLTLWTAPSTRADAQGHSRQVASVTIRQLRRHVKYLFVLYQENRSFDSYFGTFPGANGLYSRSSKETPGFYQAMVDTNGAIFHVSPFRLGRASAAADLGSVGHSHPITLAKMDVKNGIPRMDHFAMAEERAHGWNGNKPTLKAMQYGELEMAYEDGGTIPFLWRYAHRFVLCDDIFEEMAADSTPGNISIIAAQTGITQWLRHPAEAFAGNGGSGPGVPVVNDSNPFWGSPEDKTIKGKLPYNPHDYHKLQGKPGRVQKNLTFATIMLTLTGNRISSAVTHDRNPAEDLADVKRDVGAIAKTEMHSFNWGWYEEGFSSHPKSVGEDPVDADGLHVSYVTHHNGPQYFGYISNNPVMAAHLHGLNRFFTDVRDGRLQGPGVYYLKGGKRNLMGLRPASALIRSTGRFLGDDDHPGDSDSQISEALLARAVNTIAASKYWKQCAIVITWDDCEGDYDHVAPPILNIGPDGKPLSMGPRIPLLVISPYCKTGYIDHAQGCTASVVKLADVLFELTPLADLPAENGARKLGEVKYHSANMGPLDDQTPGVTGLVGAFDAARLAGTKKPLTRAYAEIPNRFVDNIELQAQLGWKWTGVTPVDIARGIVTHVPREFSPRPNMK